MDDLLNEFLTETSESMETLDGQLVMLEQTPDDPELLGSIFRLFHTVKGTCGFLGLPRLEAVAHAAESVLGRIRDGELGVTPSTITAILEALDRIRAICASLERAGNESEGDDSALIQRLLAIAAGEEAGGDTGAMQTGATEESHGQDAGEPLIARIGGEGALAATAAVFVRRVLQDEALKGLLGGLDGEAAAARETPYLVRCCGGKAEGGSEGDSHALLARAGSEEPGFEALLTHLEAALNTAQVAADDMRAVVAAVAAMRAPSGAEAADDEPDFPVAKEFLEEYERVTRAAAPEKAPPRPPTKSEGEPEGARAEQHRATQSIRVSVDVLEDLMTMVSELVLTRNQLMQTQRKHTDANAYAAPLQRLNHIVSDLQEAVMKTRMQPIGTAWGKLPRLIRDLARDLDKKIDLVLRGEDTELDRQVLELIRDPLTHMVRNSADHGLEMPDERRAAGKSEAGRITLNAFHQGGHIIIEIADDGRGLHAEKLKKKAIANGLVGAAEAETLSDTQIQQFIFRPGFSTAEAVTNVSGRGVGMDVVRSNVERIGGTIELKSTAGRGTAFTIKIPLTLTIVAALIAECGGERYAIPQISVIELVRASMNSDTRIEHLNGVPVLRLRERLLPLVSLRALLGGAPAESEEKVARESFIVVTQVGAHTFGIIVDRVYDTEEIVVKPVAPILRDIQLFSGNTILGDGSVVMILDPNGIAAASGQLDLGDRTEEAAAEEGDRGSAEKTTMLLFRACGKAPKAAPLSLVARMEEFEDDHIERLSGRNLVQYRGHLMPVLTFDGGEPPEGRRHPVLVFGDGERLMGLVVDEIIDIVEVELDLEITSGQTGILGHAVIDGHASEIIDTGHFLTTAHPAWFHEPSGRARTARKVLLVDDSPFFRNMLTPLLKTAGYDVTSLESANDALQLRERGATFDLIVSDIDMPQVNGLEFASLVRADGPWRSTPLVALSAYTDAKTRERGIEAGFDHYVAKYDREKLLETISESLVAVREVA